MLPSIAREFGGGSASGHRVATHRLSGSRSRLTNRAVGAAGHSGAGLAGIGDVLSFRWRCPNLVGDSDS